MLLRIHAQKLPRLICGTIGPGTAVNGKSLQPRGVPFLPLSPATQKSLSARNAGEQAL